MPAGNDADTEQKGEHMHQCDNCDWQGDDDALEITLHDIPDIIYRLNAGGIVPSGECPECGALCYPADIIEANVAAEQSCRALVATVEATGGIAVDEKGCRYPVADPEWLDLADAYALAKTAMGEPLILAPEVQS